MFAEPPDFLREVFPAAHLLPRHRQDLIAFLQAGLGRGGTSLHAANGRGEVGDAGKGKDQEEGHGGEEQIEGGAGHDDQETMPEGLVGKRHRLQLRRHFIAWDFPRIA